MGTDSSQTQLTLTQDALGKPAAALPKPTVKTTAADFEAIRAALQACFAGKPETRRAAAAPCSAAARRPSLPTTRTAATTCRTTSAACSPRRHDRRPFRHPADRLHATNAASQPTALLRLPYVRNDSEKSTGHLTRLATNRAAAGAPAKWELTGNQHDYDASVAPRITRVTELNPAAGVVSRYETGLRVFFNPNRGPGARAQVVRVSGPGLPAAGVVLARSRVCGTNGYLSVQNTRGSLTYAADDPISPNKTIQTTAQNTTHVVLAASPLRAGDTLDWSRRLPARPTRPHRSATRSSPRCRNSGATASRSGTAPSAAATTTVRWRPRLTWSSPPWRAAAWYRPRARRSCRGTASPRRAWLRHRRQRQDRLPAHRRRGRSNDVTDEPVDRASAFGVTPASPLPQRMYAQANYLPRNVKTITLKPDMVGSSAGESCIGAGFAAFNRAGDQRNRRSAPAPRTISTSTCAWSARCAEAQRSRIPARVMRAPLPPRGPAAGGRSDRAGIAPALCPGLPRRARTGGGCSPTEPRAARWRNTPAPAAAAPARSGSPGSSRRWRRPRHRAPSRPRRRRRTEP